MEQERLVLAEFKALYKALKTGNPALDHLLLGLLKWLEERLIDNRVKVEVDEAIKTWESLHKEDTVSPVYTERPVETSQRLPEMRITSAWYDDTVSERRANVVSRSEPPEGL